MITKRGSAVIREGSVSAETSGGQLEMSGGKPSPVDHLIGSLLGCTGLTLRRILEKRRIQVEDLELEAEVSINEDPYRIERIHVDIGVRASGLNSHSLDSALELTEKYCPVHLALAPGVSLAYSAQLLS